HIYASTGQFACVAMTTIRGRHPCGRLPCPGFKLTMAALSLCADVVVWGIDMKLGLELLPWLPVLGRLATTNEDALELLTAANRVLEARARLLAGRQGRKWRPSPEEPALVIAIDELAELSGKALALFERVARMGRAAGIVLVAVTQRPSLAALGSL